MCPSYMVTKEEMHSTRGRAHLLFEMLQGDPMKRRLEDRNGPARRSTCAWPARAAGTECPMNVDMATYKAEFLSHYYEGRLRPRHAYAMGWIYWWARLASLAAGPGQPGHSRAGRGQVAPVPGRDLHQADDAFVRPRDLQGLVAPAARRATSAGRGSSSGPTRSTTTSIRRPPWRPSRCWKPPASRSSFPGSRSAADGRSTTSACSRRPSELLREILDTLRAGDRGGHSVRRPGAKLRGRLPRRADEPLSHG